MTELSDPLVSSLKKVMRTSDGRRFVSELFVLCNDGLVIQDVSDHVELTKKIAIRSIPDMIRARMGQTEEGRRLLFEMTEEMIPRRENERREAARIRRETRKEYGMLAAEQRETYRRRQTNG